MNIAFVNSTKKWGGVKSWTIDLIKGLLKIGHQVHLVSRPGIFAEKAKDLGCEVRTVNFGPDYNPILIGRLFTYFRKNQIDVIVVNVGKDLRTGGFAARLCGIPVIHRVGLAGDMLDSRKVRLTHAFVRPQILVPCQHIKAGLLQELKHLRPEEITVIPTGKAVSTCPPSKVHTPLQFISTSQLNPDKNHRIVIMALAQLKQEGFSFHYHVVGQGKLTEELQTLANDLGLTDRITWHGFSTNVRALLRNADIFVLASRSEGLPNALLEAMAQGLVCISRDVGGVAEVWPQNMKELLLPYRAELEDFVFQFRKLLTNSDHPEHLLDLKKSFYASAQRYTDNDMIHALDTYFRDITGKLNV